MARKLLFLGRRAANDEEALEPRRASAGFNPSEADADAGAVTLTAVVRADGGVSSAAVVSESPPAQGFGNGLTCTSRADVSGRSICNAKVGSVELRILEASAGAGAVRLGLYLHGDGAAAHKSGSVFKPDDRLGRCTARPRRVRSRAEWLRVTDEWIPLQGGTYPGVFALMCGGEASSRTYAWDANDATARGKSPLWFTYGNKDFLLADEQASVAAFKSKGFAVSERVIPNAGHREAHRRELSRRCHADRGK